MNRRKFLISSACGVVSLVAMQAVYANKLGQANQRPVMVIDLNRCTGCQSCVIACKAENKTADGKFNTKILISESSKPAVTFKPVQCHHCDPAPCIDSCRSEAIIRIEGGVVVIDWSKCVDWPKCEEYTNCVECCPFNAIHIDPVFNKADKCDFCFERLQQGLEPACVESCASGARIFGDANLPTLELADYLEMQALQPSENSISHVFYLPLHTSQ